MESKTLSQSCKHNSQLFANEEGLNKISENTQKHQKSNNQLLSSKDKRSFHLRKQDQKQDFMEISLLNQENSIFNSRIYQEHIEAYNNFTSLHYATYNYEHNEAQLIIYDTKSKREKVQAIDRWKDNISWSKDMIQLPNGDWFCFSYDNNHKTTKTFFLDSDFHEHDLPSIKITNFSSGIYYNRSVYCLGAGGFNIVSKIFNMLDLDQKRWVNLSPLPTPVGNCTAVIFKGNFLISYSENINLWLYSINIDSFSTIPYEFHKVSRIMVNAEERLYLIESGCYWRIYESGIWDEFSWKFVKNFGNANFLHGLAWSGIYNKENESIYILGFENWENMGFDVKRHYWKFSLNEKELIEEKEKKCRIF